MVFSENRSSSIGTERTAFHRINTGVNLLRKTNSNDRSGFSSNKDGRPFGDSRYFRFRGL